MPFYYGSKVRSVPEYLRRRFNDPAHLFNAIAFAIATILIAGVNLYALALILQLLLGWPILVGIVVAAAIVLVYITSSTAWRRRRRGAGPTWAGSARPPSSASSSWP
jgi:SSS family solute:Na+ symporter